MVEASEARHEARPGAPLGVVHFFGYLLNEWRIRLALDCQSGL